MFTERYISNSEHCFVATIAANYNVIRLVFNTIQGPMQPIKLNIRKTLKTETLKTH
jgi:hypothetical protein